MKLLSLKKKLDFKLLFAKGKRIHQEHINIIYFLKNCNKEAITCAKLAYVVSKKNSPKAVVRNKIKRRMKAIVQRAIKDNQEKFDNLRATIFIAIRASSNSIIDASFKQLDLEIKNSLEQLIS